MENQGTQIGIGNIDMTSFYPSEVPGTLQWGYIASGTRRILREYLQKRKNLELDEYDSATLRAAETFFASATLGYRLVTSQVEALPENSAECASALEAAIKILATLSGQNIQKSSKYLQSKFESYSNAIKDVLNHKPLRKNATQRHSIREELCDFFYQLAREGESDSYCQFCRDVEDQSRGV